MPVNIRSRYRGNPVLDTPGADGVLHPTIGIRRQAAPDPRVRRYQHRVTGADTIDLVAWRFLGNERAWWRIADANPVAFPLDLRPGDAVAIAPSDDIGLLTDRERRF